MNKYLRVLLILPVLVALFACTNSPSLATRTPAKGAICPSNSYNVGYRIAHYSDVKAAVWYPTATAEQSYAYSPDISSSIAKDGQLLEGCGKFPLIIFSHGLTGCGTQSIFFTETLARNGYIVVAPDHKDALQCSVDGSHPTVVAAKEPAIMDPISWNDASYQSRRDDIEKVLNGVLQDSLLKAIIDTNHIGIAGHSLGGYTALAMVGGWPSWKDPRFKAALLLSPYSLPFSIYNTLMYVNVPLMYQGAQGDTYITPSLEGKAGAYAQSNPPKYFVKLFNGDHLTWTNAICANIPTITDCLQTKREAKLIDAYGIAFFDNYLKGKPQTLLTTDNNALASFQYQP
jgi:predicted dienelactone hydrolase